ncbi:MAG: c-type cytochrome [Siphonobacter aquaeclarae]|nr:c-type cytochrome [Siphonobacter aquaeclarae]
MIKRALSYFLWAATAIVLTIWSSTSSFAQDSAKGEKLFTQNCASCHNVGEQKLIGPGLKGVDTRHDEAWLIKWIKNPAGMVASGDEAAVKLYDQFKPTMMTAFGSMSDDDIKSILAYIKEKNAAPVAGPATPGGTAPAGATAAAGDQSSGFFSVVLVALLVVMILMLAALLGILGVLNRLSSVDPNSPEAEKIPFFARLKENAGKLGNSPAFRTGALLLFVLLAGKATLDGMYGIGIHQGYAPKQPIAFSHKLHAGEYKIDCNYCHTGVNKGKQANIPSANICMNCHNSVKASSPEIQKIYRAIEKDQPIEWIRVHNLPDLAYFNHSQHVNVGGLQCQQCHGEVQTMEVIEQRSTLTMGWCIDCHRKTNVNSKDNKYYDKLVELHASKGVKEMKVADIGGLECSKCHY